MRFVTMLWVFFAGLSVSCNGVSAQESSPSACRSVHLAFPSAEGTAFYNELTVTQSSAGTYFMACGFSKGYFGIQELANGNKVVLFSVWEPGQQDDPDATPDNRRVKKIASGDNVRVLRFGNEGTGGKSLFDYDWKVGQTCRFLVYAKLDGDRTEYAAYFYIAEELRWQHMATFSTLANQHRLRGCYSFVEDFLRNGQSAKQNRRCQIGNGWVLINDQWQPLTTAKFTADSTPINNIDAGVKGDRFFLATGGDVQNEHAKLWDKIKLSTCERKPPLDLPDPFGSGAVSRKRLRILSYNIKHGRGNDNKVDLERTARVIRRLNPDVVALQEVDERVDRSGNVDEAELLAKLTGLNHHAFGSFFDYQGGRYGMAILSRYPISKKTNLRLPNGAEPRTSLIANIALDKDNDITVANVHFYRTENERSAQAMTLLDHMGKIKGNAIIAGDFNSTPNSPTMKLFSEKWIIPAKGKDHMTFSSDAPNTEIDFAMLNRESDWTVDSIDVIEEPIASDHRPLVFELRQPLPKQVTETMDVWFAKEPLSRGSCPDDCLNVTQFGQQDFAKIKTLVWESYRRGAVKLGWQGDLIPTQYFDDLMKDAGKKERPEPKTSEISMAQNRTMPYTILAKGKKPEAGWPMFISMHGGGKSSKPQPNPHGWTVNSREWQTQILFFFRVYPNNAAYFIPRMVDDNDGRWRFHYNYEAFDQVIRRAILFHDVDPNRIYMMGISQGGYGSEALSTYMPDRLAAVCAMAAGAGDSYMENLRNLPRRTDVGEKDTMYGRINLARKCHARLDELHAQDSDGFVHQLAIQEGRGHGIDYSKGPKWLMKFSRNPFPKRIVWSTNKLHGGQWSTRAYWLGLDTVSPGQAFLTATIDKEHNRINIQAEQPASTNGEDGRSAGRDPLTQRTLTVYLHDRLVDLDKPVEIRINGTTVANRKFPRSLGVMMQSLSERGDPEYMFPAVAVFSL